MSRLPPLTPASLDANQSRLYRELVDGPRGRAGDVPLVDAAGALVGPFAVMVVAPDVGHALQSVGASLRYAAGLDPLVREATVLLVAAHRHSTFEWQAHQGPARAAGLTAEQVEQLRSRQLADGLPASATQALVAVDLLLRTGALDDQTYAAARHALGERGLVELVWLTGYYSMLALALAVFDPKDRS